MVEDLAGSDGVMGTEVPGERVEKLGSLLRIRPMAISASTAGSRSPAMSASIMLRPDIDSTSDATDVNLIPASWSTFSRRCTSAARVSLWRLR